MSARWPRQSGRDASGRESEAPAEPLYLNAAESWRSWLVTGSRARGADPRRVRGAHRGLKKMLIEGVANGGHHPESWRHFSGAMVRLAINDALNSLPSEQTRVVWLAYFAGMSNREIANQLGLSVGGVQRRLKVALARIAEHIERGRNAAFAWIMWLPGLRPGGARARIPDSFGDMARGLGAVTAGVAAAAALAIQPDAPVHFVPAPAAVGHAATSQNVPRTGSAGDAGALPVVDVGALAAPSRVSVPAVPPVVVVPRIPAPIQLPAPTKLPVPPKLPAPPKVPAL